MIQFQCSFPSPVAFMAPNGGDPREKALNSRRDEMAIARSMRVLIVEDEGLVALDMENALAEAGFKVIGIVDTEADAVAAAEHMQPDVILIDITLREGDGISAAQTIGRKIKTHIIFVSGNSDPASLAAAYKVKPAAFIRKPFVTDQLAKLVADAVTTTN